MRASVKAVPPKAATDKELLWLINQVGRLGDKLEAVRDAVTELRSRLEDMTTAAIGHDTGLPVSEYSWRESSCYAEAAQTLTLTDGATNLAWRALQLAVTKLCRQRQEIELAAKKAKKNAGPAEGN